MKDKKCLNTKKTIGNGMFCANGISLRVETRSALLDEKHLIDKTDRMRNWLSSRGLVSPWAVEKCLPIVGFSCSTIR